MFAEDVDRFEEAGNNHQCRSHKLEHIARTFSNVLEEGQLSDKKLDDRRSGQDGELSGGEDGETGVGEDEGGACSDSVQNDQPEAAVVFDVDWRFDCEHHDETGEESDRDEPEADDDEVILRK